MGLDTPEHTYMRSRIIRMRVGQALVCIPHNLIKFNELANESRLSIVDQFSVIWNCGGKMSEHSCKNCPAEASNTYGFHFHWIQYTTSSWVPCRP